MAETRFLAGLNRGDNFTEFSGPTVASGLGFYGTTFGSSAHSSPGTSGLRPNGPDTSDERHDWYFALSASPTSVGAKSQLGLYFGLQFL
ncbi:MAG: hypothetical protein AMXMBFR13_37730 [Phycisphaerae bacterium]